MNDELSRLFSYIKITEPSVSVTETDEYNGTLVAEPLLKGYGMTIGNSLRRILLSSLPGSAVTGISLASNGVHALHEFTVLPGVKEDVTEIVLNVKEIVSTLYSDEPRTYYIHSQSAGVVRAGDIQHGSELVIINPEHVIATLSENTSFSMELTFSNGVGYVSADRNKQKSSERKTGHIFVDSIYTPVQKVSYKVENARVAGEMDYDRLILEVTTNGSISPRESVIIASQILKEHCSLLTSLGGNYTEPSIMTPCPEDEMSACLEKSIEELDFSVRSYNALRRAGISTVGDLAKMTKDSLLKIRNLGTKSYNEILEKIAGVGVSFRDDEC